jgi:hypothetical protein
MSNADRNRIRSSLREGPTLALAAVICLCLAYGNTRANEASAGLVREHLYAGTLAAGEAALTAKVNADGGDREARFGLGLVSFARAVERFGQALYRYGLTRRRPCPSRFCASRCRPIRRQRRSPTRRFGIS